MQIFHLMLYKNPQTIQKLDDYQVEKFSCHIEVRKEGKPQVNYDVKLESPEEIVEIMQQKPRHQKRLK